MLIYKGLCDLLSGKRPLYWQWLMIVETSGIASLYLEPGHITTSSFVEDGWLFTSNLYCTIILHGAKRMVLECFFVWLLSLNAIYWWLFTRNLYCTIILHGAKIMVLKCFFVLLLSLNAIYGWLFTNKFKLYHHPSWSQKIMNKDMS